MPNLLMKASNLLNVQQSSKTICLWLVLLWSLLQLTPINAEIIAEDDFEDYSVGNISGNNSGTGWSGSWSTGSSSKQAKVIDTSSSPLEYTDSNGKTISGGNRAIEITENNNDVARRDLSASYNNTEIYASMLIQFTGTQNGNDFLANWLHSSSSNNPNFGIKMNFGSGGADFFTRTKNGKEVYSTDIVNGQTYFLVMKVWKTGSSSSKYNRAQLWVNPTTLETEPSASSSTSSSSSSLSSFSKIGFRSVNLDNNDSIIVDEIRYGTTWDDVTSSENQSENLIVNGSFEEPVIGANSWSVSNTLEGWTIDAQGIEIRNNAVGAAFEGDQFVELDVSSNTSISQTITTTTNQNYDLSFAYSPRINKSASTNNIQVYWNGSLLDDLTGTGSSSHNWQTYTYIVEGTGSDQLTFTAAGISDGSGGSLDNVVLTTTDAAIPDQCETTLPTDYALFSDSQIKLSKSIKVNGNTVSSGTYSGSTSIDANGSLKTSTSLTLPALDPSTFPSNSETTDIKSNSDININVTSETYYDEVKLESEDTSITFTGGGTLHIDKLETKKENSTINFAAGTYYIDEFKISKKESVINITSTPVILHIGSKFEISKEKVTVNQNGDVDDFIVYLHSGSKFNAKKEDLDFTGILYGPDVSEVKFEKENNKFRGLITVGGGKIEIKKEDFQITYTESDKEKVAALGSCDSVTTPSECESTLPTDYVIYANNKLTINNSINVNGNSIGYNVKSPKAAVDINGNLTTNTQLELPSLSPSTFPSNSSGTSITRSSDIELNNSSEVFYDAITQNRTSREITFTGGGTVHIETLTSNANNTTINFAAGTYFINNLVMNGINDVINITSSPVYLHIGQNFTLNNNNQKLNQSGNVEDFVIYLHNSAKFTSNSNNSVLTGFIYGPQADEIVINPSNMTVNGGMVMGGGDITINSSPLNINFTSTNQTAFETCDSSTLDHFRLSYSSNGLTCLPSSIALKACESADCSNLYTQAVDVTLSGAGTWSANPVSLTTGESSDLTFQATTAGDTTLAISASTVTPANPIQCYEDGVLDADCSINVSDAGFVFDIPTITACKSSADVTIRAVQLDNQTNQCIGALTGTQSVNFFSTYSSPNTGTNKVAISGTEVDTATPGTAVNLTFNADGEATFTAKYDDAGEVRLDAEFDNGSGLALSGNDTFVAIPAALYVFSDETNASCSGGDASCSLFKKAGESFDLKVNAACWQTDGDTDYSDNPTTPNFELASIAVDSSLVAPSGGNNATLATTSFNFTTSDAGSHTMIQSVSEVGVFTFSVSSPSYFGETLSVKASENIGRFYPDHFKVTAQSNGAFGSHSCGTFTYTGQSFGYQTAPSLTVTAYNSANAITQNYKGDFAKLIASNFSVTAPTTDANALGADNTNKVSLSWSPDAANLTDNSDGSHSFSFGNDSYQYLKQTNSMINAFTNALDLSFTAITDSDGVATQSLPVTLQPSGENIRFGRIAIANAYGSELTPLPIALTTEYFDGFNWQTNTADTCTALSLSNQIRLQNTATNSGALQIGTANMVIDTGTTSISALNFANGQGTITFTAPGEDNQGYVDIQSNLTGSYDWLLDDSDSDGSFDDEAKGKASFGIFKGSDRIIFRREVY